MVGPRICIAQPEHLPWLGYFDKISRVDVFVFLDNVQFKKRYFENRNRIRSPKGWVWLTVPVRSKGRFDQLIQEVEIDNERNWQRSHWKTLQLNYGRAACFDRYCEYLEDIYIRRLWSGLIELNTHLIRWGAEQFSLKPKFLLASELGVEGCSSELLLAICQKLEATTYLSGVSGKDYLDEGLFREHGITIEYQEFHHPIYRQLYNPFEPCMAFIDLLFNYGPESRKILLDPRIERLETVFT